MPQSRLIVETDGAQAGFRGVQRSQLRNKGTNGQFPPAARASEEGTNQLLHHSPDSTSPHFNGKAITTLRLAAVIGNLKIFATSRQALCRSIRALEMAAFKGKPFRETNEGYLKQRPCPLF